MTLFSHPVSGRDVEEQHDYEAPERDPEVEAAVAAMEPAPANEAPPQPISAGTYALYPDGAGGLVLTLAQSTGESVQHRIPAGMLKMAARFGGAGISDFGRMLGLKAS